MRLGLLAAIRTWRSGNSGYRKRCSIAREFADLMLVRDRTRGAGLRLYTTFQACVGDG